VRRRRPSRIVGWLAILLTTTAVGATAPAVGATDPAVGATAPDSALGPPPFWKALRGIRSAWKESPEARVAVKAFRKTTTRAVSEWRRSKGSFCPWRSVKPTYCRNGWVFAAVGIDFSVSTPSGRVYVGSVKSGTLLSAACVYYGWGPVRVLWPTSMLPSAVVSQALLDPYQPSELEDLPWC
jgi:hypothetical protein